jgi:hypothetical protein
MNDTSLEACVRKAGEAVGKRVQSATAATAAAAGQAQEIVADGTAMAAGRAKKALDDASEAAQQARSQAGAVAEDVLDTGRRATSFPFLADRREPIDRGSGRVRTRLRCGLVDSPTTVDYHPVR